MQHLLTDPVSLMLVPDGDHRLSRPEDLALLERVVAQMVTDVLSPPRPEQGDLFAEEP